jgi:hypothetical protein
MNIPPRPSSSVSEDIGLFNTTSAEIGLVSPFVPGRQDMPHANSIGGEEDLVGELMVAIYHIFSLLFSISRVIVCPGCIIVGVLQHNNESCSEVPISVERTAHLLPKLCIKLKKWS